MRCAARPAPQVPRGRAFADMVAGHYEAMLSFYGRDLGGRVARKHLGWYMDDAGTPAAAAPRDPDRAPTPAGVLRPLPDGARRQRRVAA